MPLSSLDALRLRVSDRYRYAEEIRQGDGTASAFKLAQGAPFSNVISASAYVATTAGWTTTGASFDTGLGLLTLSGVVSALSAFRVQYVWSVFSDDEMNYFLGVGPGVAGAALEAVKSLMFDGLRRARWSAPDGTSYDDTAAMNHLRGMYAQLHDEAREAPDGGIESWSEQQEYYSGEYGA